MFEIPPGLVALLQGWYERCGKPANDVRIVTDIGIRRIREAAALRDDLKAAGIKRTVLLGGPVNVEPLRFHDLRATFVTWAIREGRPWNTSQEG
jgi:integrase